MKSTEVEHRFRTLEELYFVNNETIMFDKAKPAHWCMPRYREYWYVTIN